MTFGSLFAGIEGFGLGLEAAGFRCLWQVEKDKTCLKVLNRHWPELPKVHDVRKVRAGSLPRVDLICGGFPCQDLSVAGRRGGLSGERSGLFWEMHRILEEYLPTWFLIENVPGLYSSWSDQDGTPGVGEGAWERLSQTNDFETVSAALSNLGYGVGWRVLDSQYFGLAQRRDRVFIVGHLGDPKRFYSRHLGAKMVERRRVLGVLGKVLFDADCVSRNSPPSREAGTRVASTITGSFGKSGGRTGGNNPGMINPVIANCLDAHMGMGGPDDNAAQANHLVAAALRTSGHCDHDGDESKLVAHMDVTPIDMRQASRGATMTNNRTDGGAPGTGIGQPGDPCPTLGTSHPHAVAHTLRAEGADASEDGTGRGTPLVTCFDERNVTSKANRSQCEPDVCPTMHARPMAIGFKESQSGCTLGDVHATIDANKGSRRMEGVLQREGVRRLTPRECERLQGFPDDWTRYGDDGKEISDSQRYRCLGNAVSVPVAAWLGKRILEAS